MQLLTCKEAANRIGRPIQSLLTPVRKGTIKCFTDDHALNQVNHVSVHHFVDWDDVQAWDETSPRKKASKRKPKAEPASADGVLCTFTRKHPDGTEETLQLPAADAHRALDLMGGQR